jgi:2-polyprenyl-3-methyl-5-hydroxy-6-metoxy-1,4-benzoquinol methylase
MRGYRVHGSDVSGRALRRAAFEARRRGLAPTFQLADMRSLQNQVRGRFDVVICCDNSIAHVLTSEDLASTVDGMAAKIRTGGLLLVSLRDYDRHRRARPAGTGPVITGGGARVAFQQWAWLDEHTYESRLFVLENHNDQWQVRAFEGATSRAWTRDELDSHIAAAGASDVRWELPPEGAYHQPLLIARWPS